MIEKLTPMRVLLLCLAAVALSTIALPWIRECGMILPQIVVWVPGEL